MSHMEKDKRRRLAKKSAETMERLDLPEVIVSDIPRMELTGNRMFYMDRHRGVLSYTTECIDIGGGSVVIRLHGSDLQIVAMTDEELRVSGKIDRLELVE